MEDWQIWALAAAVITGVWTGTGIYFWRAYSGASRSESRPTGNRPGLDQGPVGPLP